MHSFAIIADNSCALRKQYRERFGVDGIIYGTITYPDGHTEFGDLDYERITPEDYFRSISKKAMYKTACANIDQMVEVMEPFAKEGKDIVFITISSALGFSCRRRSSALTVSLARVVAYCTRSP